MLNGPVPECLRLVHGKELPVPKGWNSLLPTWESQVTIARNCRFPVRSNLGTMGYHCKQLPVPTWEPQVTIAKNFQFLKVGTDGSQRGIHRLPGTAGSQTLKLTVPNLGTRLPLQGIAGSQKLEFMFSKLSNFIVRNCGFPKLETHGSKPEKVTLPVEGSVDCKKLELMVLNVVLFCLLSR